MNQSRDWKPIIVLALAGLFLFMAFRGARGGWEYGPAAAGPQQIIVQPAAPAGGTIGVAPVPVVVTAPVPQVSREHHFGGGPFALFPLLFLAGLAFLAFRFFGNNRRGWSGPGGPGGWGGPGGGAPWSGPNPNPNTGPQAPHYGPQQGQQPQPQQPKGDAQSQGEPTRWTGGSEPDITRPEEDRSY